MPKTAHSCIGSAGDACRRRKRLTRASVARGRTDLSKGRSARRLRSPPMAPRTLEPDASRAKAPATPKTTAKRAGPHPDYARVETLQRTAGNQAVASLLSPPTVQRAPGDGNVCNAGLTGQAVA